MKKHLLIAALAALSIGSASAQTIYITGSTAFRTAANKALFTALGTNNIAATDKSARDASDAGNLLFTNVTVNGSTVDVVVAWSGSELGIRTVASGTNNLGIPFYSKAKMASNGTTFPAYSMAGGNMNTLVVNSNTILAKGDIAFSDTYQGASVYPAGGVGPDGYTYKSLTGTRVGVVPFTFAGSKGFPVQDITTSIFDDLAKNGNVTLNQFNGDTNSSGTNAKVWLMGRNPDSGTRVTTLMVAKTGRTTALTQWTPTTGSEYTWSNTVSQVVTNTTATNIFTNGVADWTNIATATKIVSIAKSIATTNYGISISAGNSGESSGGTLCGYLINTFLTNVAVSGASRGSAGNYAVCYAGVSDATGKYTTGLVPLKYNGVAGRHFTTNPIAGITSTNLDEGYTNIISGKYPFWSYEFIMTDNTATNASTVTNLASTLVANITNKPSTSSDLAPNISLSEMKVQRTSDGGAITPR